MNDCPLKNPQNHGLFPPAQDRVTKALYFISAFALFYFFIFSFRISCEHGDDGYYVQFTVTKEWLLERYETWSSRLILDAIMVTLTHHHWLFRVLSALSFSSLPWLLRSILCNVCGKEKLNSLLPSILIFAVVFLFPVHTMSNSGWIATVTNYFFPFYLMVATTVLLSKVKTLALKDVSFVVLAILSLIVAGNQELCAALMLGLSILCLIFNIKRKCALLVLVIAALSLYSTLNCLGNSARYLFSLQYIEGYWAWNSPYKLYMGTVATLRRYFFSGNAITVFTVMILVMCVKQNLKLSFIAGLSMLAFQGVARMLVGGYKHQEIRYYLDDNFTFTISGAIGTLCLVMLVFLVIRLFLELDISRRHKWILGTMTGCAFGDRAMMGFSPSLFSSDARTYIFADFALLMCSVCIALLSKKLSRRHFTIILLACTILQFGLQGSKIVKHLIGYY